MTLALTIRRAEPEDFAAVQAIYAGPLAQAGTLQLPLPSLDLWRQRLQAADPNAHVLLACAGDEVVGQLGLYAGRHRDFAYRDGAFIDAVSLARLRP